MYKEGEFAYHDFELVQVKKLNEEGRVTELSDGFFGICGGSLEKYMEPLTLQNKMISEEFARLSKTIHERGNVGLNYPDINRELITMWIFACADASESGTYIRKAEKFIDDILKAQVVEVGGINLFPRPR